MPTIRNDDRSWLMGLGRDPTDYELDIVIERAATEGRVLRFDRARGPDDDDEIKTARDAMVKRMHDRSRVPTYGRSVPPEPLTWGSSHVPVEKNRGPDLSHHEPGDLEAVRTAFGEHDDDEIKRARDAMVARMKARSLKKSDELSEMAKRVESARAKGKAPEW